MLVGEGPGQTLSRGGEKVHMGNKRRGTGAGPGLSKESATPGVYDRCKE